MQHVATKRISWKKALLAESPLLLPVAHDGLTARIIESAGFCAVQIGGFAVEGSRHGIPDIDLTHLAERYAAVKDIMGATSLPIMVDGDDGYGDAKNITYTVRAYERLGVQALFLEDQRAPKECGHMDNKKVVPAEQMVNKIKAALDARTNDEFFILARTDSINPEGLDGALRRGEKYLKAGADGLYVEGAETVEQLEAVGKAFKGKPLATSVLENGGKTPWLPPRQFGSMGFTMILYPTSILFRSTYAIQHAAADLRAGHPLDPKQSVNMETFEKIVDLEHWRAIEKKFPVTDQQMG